MNRPRNSRASNASAAYARRDHGGTMVGIFIGLVIGLGMAASVAFWLMKNNPAFQPAATTNAAREPAKEAATRVAKNDAAEKPRFDFYKILPGTEEARAQSDRKPVDRSDRAVVEQSKERIATKTVERSVEPVVAVDKAAPISEKVALAPERTIAEPGKSKTGERFWLQAGSFSTESDAENLKARLAFAGWQATVQQGLLADKAVRYRVRLGPYDNSDEMQRIKSELGKRGFEAAVIKF